MIRLLILFLVCNVLSCSDEEFNRESYTITEEPVEEMEAQILPLAELLVEPEYSTLSLEHCLDEWHDQNKFREFNRFTKAEFLRWCHPESDTRDVADHP